jgi:hypothetical protein
MESAYRLGRFKIMETDGALRWEAPSGLGATKTGRCLILGDILVLGPAYDEAPGLLRREFLHHLKKLPLWGKTKFYCQSDVVHKCRGGHSLAAEMQNAPARQGPHHAKAFTSAPFPSTTVHSRQLPTTEEPHGVWSAVKSTLTELRQACIPLFK